MLTVLLITFTFRADAADCIRAICSTMRNSTQFCSLLLLCRNCPGWLGVRKSCYLLPITVYPCEGWCGQPCQSHPAHHAPEQTFITITTFHSSCLQHQKQHECCIDCSTVKTPPSHPPPAPKKTAHPNYNIGTFSICIILNRYIKNNQKQTNGWTSIKPPIPLSTPHPPSKKKDCPPKFYTETVSICVIWVVCTSKTIPNRHVDGPPPNTLPPTPPNKQIHDFKSTTTTNTSVSWSRGQCWSSRWARCYLRGLLETKCSLRSCLPLLSCTAVMAALQKKHSRLLNSCRLMQVLRERKQRGQSYWHGCNCLHEERGNIYAYAPNSSIF